jgi:putative ABC transport system substrate-binding protein
MAAFPGLIILDKILATGGFISSAAAINTEGEATMKARHVALRLMIVLGAVLAPSVADAQAPTKMARVGWMARGNPTASDSNMDAFRRGMRELGYMEGQTFVIEPRYAGGKPELMREQAAELERAAVDVIIAGPFEALQAAKHSTSRVPIIMTPSADPVATGIVKSLDRPAGNITGITEMMPELTPQRLILLRQIVPTLSRVAILWQPGTLSEDAFTRMLQETQATARSIGVHLQVVEAAKVEDFDAAFAAMAQERAEGLIVLVNPMFNVQRQHIIERAAKQSLPAIYEWTPFVRSGGLISYGADVPDVYRRAAGFVDKVLKGAKPGDLPVEGPMRYDMAVNLKVAKALGVTIPESIVKQAVEVIE